MRALLRAASVVATTGALVVGGWTSVGALGAQASPGQAPPPVAVRAAPPTAASSTTAVAAAAPATPAAPAGQAGSVRAVPAGRAGAAAARVVRCGAGLCADGQPWRLRAASIYGSLDSPAGALDLLAAAGGNTVRVTDFLDGYLDGSGAGWSDPAAATEAALVRVDAVVAQASARGLRVLLDLSTYRNALVRRGTNPYTADWGPWLRQVMAHRNAATGLRYRDDPAVALVSLAGEVEPLTASAGALTTSTAQLTEFYRRTLRQLRQHAPSTLGTTGGLLQLDWDSGIDWRTIMSLPEVSVCAVHVYSDNDLRITVPAVAAHCASLGKPWVVEEFGASADQGDAARASLFSQWLSAFAASGAAGTGVWNVGPQRTGTHDVNPSTPQAWAALSAAWRS